MRRGINIRKKKKIILNEINRKSIKILSLLFILLILCIFIYLFFIQDILIKSNVEYDNSKFSSLNENIPFSLNKIVLFSSATAEAGTLNQLLSLDISQYCDIGIYLNKIKDENISISSLYIDNISISNPELGTTYLYKKIVTDLGKCTFTEDNIISDRLDFNVINTQDSINYENYNIYSDGSTPICLGFYNKNIRKNFISDNSEIIYDGTLLKDARIPLVSLNCNVSFKINIITNSNEHYICNVSFNIPFENNEETIYDIGHITKEYTSSETNTFIRIK